MKFSFCFLLLFFIFNAFVFTPLYAESDLAAIDDNSRPTSIFYNFGNNWLGSFTHNYGMNFIGAGLGTWAMVETGLDWEIRNAAGKSDFFMSMGMPALLAGNLVPMLTPLTFYIAGKVGGDRKMISTAAALSQALLITLSIQTPLKMITGRPSTDLPLKTRLFNRDRSPRTEDFSNEFDWFNMNFGVGWPSGHTATAFSAAAVLAELYRDKPALVIGAYAWAVGMGISMATSVHWASDVLAGALMGQAVGKTVGRSYARPHEKREDVSMNVFGNTVGFNLRF